MVPLASRILTAKEKNGICSSTSLQYPFTHILVQTWFFFFFSFIVKDTSTFFLDLTTQYSFSGPKEYSRGSCFFLELLYQGEVEDLVSDYDLVQTKPESILAL